MTVTYDRATDFEAGLREVKDLAPQHWDEFSYFPGVAERDINWGMYARLNQAGSLQLFTAHCDGKLIGYDVFTVGRHQHRDPKIIFAQEMVLYVAPGPTRPLVLLGLVRYSEAELRKLGVKVMLARSKLDHDIGPLLKSRGFKPLEVTYGKVLT